MIRIENRRSRYDYHILDRYVAGLSLFGHEVKGVRLMNVDMSESFCRFDGDELYIYNMSIVPPINNIYNVETTRTRKLLLKRSELDKLAKSLIKGMTIIPLAVFESEKGLIKVDIATAKGKKEHDKRETIKKRDENRIQNDDQ